MKVEAIEPLHVSGSVNPIERDIVHDAESISLESAGRHSINIFARKPKHDECKIADKNQCNLAIKMTAPLLLRACGV